MGVHVTVKCPACSGRGRKGNSESWIRDYCEACRGTGEKFVWEENLGEAQGKLLQKQIDDAKL